MDLLFIIVAQLLVLPVILWALIGLELVTAVLGTILGLLLGRRNPTQYLRYRLRRLRRRLIMSLSLLACALVLIDLLKLEEVVAKVLEHLDERGQLEARFAEVEGSVILGRLELRGLEVSGERGRPTPRDAVDLKIDELIVDVDTAALLTGELTVEQLSVRGVRGRWDRLPTAATIDEPRPRSQLARDFGVTHVSVEDVELIYSTGEQEATIVLDELHTGPIRSDNVMFDLLTHSRGRGAVAGHPFSLINVELDGEPRSTLTIPDLPLARFNAPVERSTGLRVSGRADLEIDARVIPRAPAQTGEREVDLAVDVDVRGFELDAGESGGLKAALLLRLAQRSVASLGEDFELEFDLIVREDELTGVRSVADSGLVERVGEAVAAALRDRVALAQQPHQGDRAPAGEARP